MNKFNFLITIYCGIFSIQTLFAQDYFLEPYGPYDDAIKSPEAFLSYPIGSHHTRHDRIVSYFEYLSNQSEKANLEVYGETYEKRPLIILTITKSSNLQNLDQIRQEHLMIIDTKSEVSNFSELPIIVNLGYGVHGNEPSSAEAAMLTAYTLVASKSDVIKKYLENAVIFIDPVINPDGRDRHTQWANMYKANPLVSDPMDAEHQENWPGGRTNHYWFDLNRDWYLAIHPESRGKLKWYHQWYPNVVTDFHEMGSNSTYFFEPMKANASKEPIMPKENYTTLNETFAKYYAEALDEIGSLYFTQEVFDGTYPGYGSSYPDLQGGLALLFEQASSRGHVQERDRGKLTFAFTIRNQFRSSMATVKAAVENKEMMLKYQVDFFESAISNARNSGIDAYVFGDNYDQSRTRAFIDKLLMHNVTVYRLSEDIVSHGTTYSKQWAYAVSTEQPQYRIIQSAFETYNEYSDSVYYDASAWSLANFYNMTYSPLQKSPKFGDQVSIENNKAQLNTPTKSTYAYLVKWDDFYAPAFLNSLLECGVNVASAFKPFNSLIGEENIDFGYGSLVIPVYEQKISQDSLFKVISSASAKWHQPVYSVTTGRNLRGVDLGSGNIRTIKRPKALLLIGNGVSSYEAGEIWHLLDTRVNMPITKVHIENFKNLNLFNYNTMIMVSGRYQQLDSALKQRIKIWVNSGNTLITTRSASQWVIKNNIVSDSLIDKKKNTDKIERLPYADAREYIGRERVGGAIFQVDLDITHPLAFGYHNKILPVYRNSNVWLKASKNPYSTVAKYTQSPHIDGFITNKNLNEYLKPSASLIVSKVGSGRAILFADNPNFRSSFLGTNRLLLNAIFLGNHIRVPE